MSPPGEFQSIAIENLTPTGSAQTLTGSYAATEQSMRVDSKVSMQFQLAYAKNAGEAAASSKYLDCYLEYTFAKDSEATTGFAVPSSGDWRPYKEEVDDGAGNSTFQTRHFRILSNDAELSAVFSRPLLCRRARLQVKEVGVAAFGTVAVLATAQAI